MPLLDTFQLSEKQLAQGNNYWLVGTFWNEEEPAQRLPIFIRDSIWINGNGEKKIGERVNSVKIGDILIAKSEYQHAGKGYLRINAVGKVSDNPRNSNSLKVGWFKDYFNVTLEDLGFYSDTIQQIRQQDLNLILNAIAGSIESIEKVGNKNSETLKHALSHSKEDKELQKEGYHNQGLIGYINTEENVDVKMATLDEVYLSDEDDYLYSTDISKESLQGHQWTQKNGNNFRLVNLEKTNNSNKLYRYFRQSKKNKGSDHFYCTNPIPQKILAYGYRDETNEHQEVFLWQDSGKNRRPLYIYSKTPSTLLFTPLNENSEYSRGNIEYVSDAEILPDTIAKRDNLGRKNLMEIVFDKITKLWSGLSEDQSFTILLNGEWGSGKSSMLYYLEGFLKENKWMVVQYNAWENQRFEEPWWILVNKVSKEASNSRKSFSNISHWFWKNWLKHSLTWIGVILMFIILIISFSYDVFGDTKNTSFIASVLALMASLWVTLQGILQNLFNRKTFSTLHTKNANDPLEPYKNRFKNVVRNKKVAIFIDDLDRCEVDATVKLLEGIQTLFKNSKVLYVIAADGHWVSTCFDKKYDQFNGLIRSGQTIGNQFLQKTFQLIVDVPKLNKPQQQSLLNKYLKRSDKNHVPETTLDVIKDIEQAETLTQLGNISEGSGLEGTKVAAQKAEKIIEKQKEHYIQKLLEEGMMPQNPRQMIRLINLFTLKIQELIISEVLTEVGEDNTLRYILFSTENPEYNYAIRHLSETSLKEKYPDVERKLKPLNVEMLKKYF